MKVVVKKRYLNYAIGEEIEVRPQDAKLLIPRGVVALPEEVQPKKPERKKRK